MPTLIQFAGGERVIVEEDLQTVNASLQGSGGGQFTRESGGATRESGGASVIVYAATVAYIEARGQDPEPMVARG